MDVIRVEKPEEFAVKGKILKEKAALEPNFRCWTRDLIDDKAYITTDSLEDEKWYRIRVTDKEVEIAEIVVIRELSDFNFNI